MTTTVAPKQDPNFYPVAHKTKDGPPNISGVTDLKQLRDLYDQYRHPGDGLYPNGWSYEQQWLHVINHILQEQQQK